MLKFNEIISFITAFKPFESCYDRIQRSAIYSWLYNAVPVYAADSELDIHQVCLEYENLSVLNGVLSARDKEFNTNSPVLTDLILKALVYIETPWIALINSDIIITKDFAHNIQIAFDKYGSEIFITGTRYNIDFNYTVDMLERYNKVCNEPRVIADIFSSSDIFITSKDTWSKIIMEMPPFILGRFAWDNWLHFYGELHTDHYNCTNSLITLHGNHDHSHILAQEGKAGRMAPSSAYNLSLLKPMTDLYGPTVRINHWQPLNLNLGT